MEEDENFSLRFIMLLSEKTLREFAEKMEIKETEKLEKEMLIKEINNKLGLLWFDKAATWITLKDLKKMSEKYQKAKTRLSLKSIILEQIQKKSLENFFKEVDLKIQKSICTEIVGLEFTDTDKLCEDLKINEMLNVLNTFTPAFLEKICNEVGIEIDVKENHQKNIYTLLRFDPLASLKKQFKKKRNLEIEKKRFEEDQDSFSQDLEEENRYEKHSKSIKKSPKKNKKRKQQSLGAEKRVYALTGRLNLKRNRLIKLIKKRGFKYTDDMDEATHLISNDPYYYTKKTLEARKKKLPIIHETYFSDHID